MQLSEQFEQELESAISELSENEWAVAQMRDRLCAGAAPSAAFENVVDVLHIAARKPDVLMECCWMAMALARRSATTQIPDGLELVLLNLAEPAKHLRATQLLEEIYAWYRIAPNFQFDTDATRRPT